MRLHRLFGCVFATQADRGHYNCAYCQEHPLFHLYYGKEAVASRSTLLICKGVYGFDPSWVAIDCRRGDFMRMRGPQPGRNRYRKYAVFFSLWILLRAEALPAQQRNLSQEKRAAIEKAVASFMSANSVPGLSVAVVLDGELRWSQGFGMADLENFSPATSSTLFRLGSISKTISATAILQLWERGKLDLDAPVQKYCPAFP